jgi:hypothetical protein
MTLFIFSNGCPLKPATPAAIVPHKHSPAPSPQQVGSGNSVVAVGDFTPGFSMKRICSWCGAFMGLSTCRAEQQGQVSHGICPACLAKRKPKVFPVGVQGGAASQDRSARLAHNQEVVGSNPTPATNLTDPFAVAQRSAEWIVSEAQEYLSQSAYARARIPLPLLKELLGRLKVARRQLEAILR